MDKNDICDELDKLKLKIMMDLSFKDSLEEYEDWVDEMQMCGKYASESLSSPRSTGKYAKFATIMCLVDDLFYKKHSHRFEYHKNRRQFRETIKEAVAMTLFVLDKQNETQKTKRETG